MGQGWAKASVRCSSAYCMAVHASVPFKHSPARDCTGIFDRGLLLGMHPVCKLLGSIYRNAEQHLGVLCSAVLCALTKKNACALRVHPHFVGMVRNEVRLACELRHPKAVVGIGREQLQKRW